ncbi:uncharacterized protein PV09_09797, partial [Verruconis gallopava]
YPNLLSTLILVQYCGVGRCNLMIFSNLLSFFLSELTEFQLVPHVHQDQKACLAPSLPRINSIHIPSLIKVLRMIAIPFIKDILSVDLVACQFRSCSLLVHPTALLVTESNMT